MTEHKKSECDCPACAARKAIKEIVGDILGEMKKPENTLHVGVISPELLARIKADSKARFLAELDIDQRVLNTKRDFLEDRITEESLDAAQADYTADVEAWRNKYDASNKTLWGRIYLELLISDTDRSFDLDMETGEVTTKKRRGELGAMYGR